MSSEGKLTVMIEIFLVLLCSICHNEILVEASIRDGKAKASLENDVLKEHSSKQISANKEEKLKSEEQQLYYLPTQTIFGMTETVKASGGFSTTSPPHLTINPAPIQTRYQQSASLFQEDPSVGSGSGPFQSDCVSETPINELESHLLMPSKGLNSESVIMSGHLEIASKTSSVEDVSEINNMVSQPSIILQGTILHSHTASDL